MNYQKKRWKMLLAVFFVTTLFLNVSAQNCPDVINVDDENNDCLESVTIMANTDSGCQANTYQWSIDLYSDGFPELSGPGLLVIDDFPVGQHQVSFTGGSCEPDFNCTTTVQVNDIIGPITICVSTLGLATYNGPNQPFVLSTSDFNANSLDSCTEDLILNLNLVEIVDGNPFYLDTPNGEDSIELNCDNLGENLVQLWAIDAAGNFDVCVSSVFLQDPNLFCFEPYALSGNVSCSSGNPIPGVEIDIFTTDENGNYGTDEFMEPQITLFPFMDDETILGIDAYDLFIASQSLLGTINFNSPYQYIAADLNVSGSITTIDLIQLEQLILGIAAPTNLWAFVDADFVFPDPTNPWLTAVPDGISINSNSGEVEADFIAIKRGDLRSGCGQFHEPDENLDLQYNQSFNTEGQLVVGIYCLNCDDVVAFQFDLDYDEQLTILDIDNTSGIVIDTYIGNQSLRSLWVGTENIDLSPVDPIFEITFENIDYTALPDDYIQLDVSRIKAEAYREDGYTKGGNTLNGVCPLYVEVEDSDGNCLEYIDLILSPDSSCNDMDFSWSIDQDNDGTIDFEGIGIDASGEFPVGTHQVNFTNEICGNTCSYFFNINNPFGPTANAFANGQFSIPESTELVVNASDINDGSFDDCSDPVSLQINLVQFSNGQPVYLEEPPGTESITLICDDIGIIFFQLWAIDESGNYDSDNASYQIIDPNEYCQTIATNDLKQGQPVFYPGYPNPFSQHTTLIFSLSESQDIEIEIFNSLGKRVFKTKSNYQIGDHFIELTNDIFDSSGVYYCQYTFGESKITQKLIRL